MLDKDCTSHKPKLQKIKRPFSLEKIKEGLGDMFVKANLLEKVRDLKLKRKLLKLKKKINIIPEGEIQIYNNNKDYKVVQVQSDLFSPQINTNFPKKRPYMIFFDKFKDFRNKSQENEEDLKVKCDFLEKFPIFTKKIKISQSLAYLNSRPKYNTDLSLYHVNQKNSVENIQLNIIPLSKSPYNAKSEISRLGQIATSSLKYNHLNNIFLTNKTEFDNKSSIRIPEESIVEKNNNILSKNNKINRNVMHSRMNGEYLSSKLIQPSHFGSMLTLFDNDIAYNRGKSLEIKLKKIINFNS